MALALAASFVEARVGDDVCELGIITMLAPLARCVVAARNRARMMGIGTYRCAVCGKVHQGPALSYGFAAPLAYDQVPRWLRWYRCHLTTDTCRIDERHFFVLGNIRIPIRDPDSSFLWTVWVSLSKDNFQKCLDLWLSPEREREPPYFGWLSNSIPGYPETLNLKTMVHTQAVGLRPEVELEPTGHPLSAEQRNGMTWERVNEIASIANHHIGR